MTTRSNGDADEKHWESVHVCPKCAFVIKINLRTITTGIVDCPRCKWVGAIEIQIAEFDEITD